MNDEWSTSSNDAVQLSLVRASNTDSDVERVVEFSPVFTYPIFGDAEQIFGYKGLDIDIQFAQHDGSPHVAISYDQKFPQVKSTRALDLNKALKEFLPARAFDQGYLQTLRDQPDLSTWKPPGEKVHEYTKKGQNYEIWAGSLADPAINRLIENIQICILFFVEGGRPLVLDEVDWSLERWRAYFVYQKSTVVKPNCPSYTILGYSTTYRFWRFPFLKKNKPEVSLLDGFPNVEAVASSRIESRLRISQFLLLPPYQGSGHGSQLYHAIHKIALDDSAVSELTVEDPSEEFDQLRDMCDWKTLEPQLKKLDLRIDTDRVQQQRRVARVPSHSLIPIKALQEIRKANKIAPRQFWRLVEMYLLGTIPYSHRSAGGVNVTKVKIQKHTNKDVDDRKYYWWRILLKQRIYRKNRLLLKQMSLEEKHPSIEDSCRGVEDEYEKLLILFMMRQARADGLLDELTSEGSSSRKRKVVEDDDDEDDEDDEDGGDVEGSGGQGEVEMSVRKRAKTEEAEAE